MAQVEIWNERQAGRFSSDELSQGCTSPGVKGCSAAGEAAEEGERCSRAASAPVCGTVSAGLRGSGRTVGLRVKDGLVACAHQRVHFRPRKREGQAVTGGVWRLWRVCASCGRGTYASVGIEVRISRVVIDLGTAGATRGTSAVR
eukprot:6179397-Pleurochrysis_carterae.AAC.1